MSYEIHGEGAPLLLLPGAYMTIDAMGPLVPGLAATRQVIAVEQQGHGHTADIDRPITYEQMAEDIRGITAPTLVVLGDSDLVRLEHAVELFGLLGGGVMGDLVGLPKSRLAVLPAASHFVPPGCGVLDRAEWLLAMIPPFLDAPLPAAT